MTNFFGMTLDNILSEPIFELKDSEKFQGNINTKGNDLEDPIDMRSNKKNTQDDELYRAGTARSVLIDTEKPLNSGRVLSESNKLMIDSEEKLKEKNEFVAEIEA